MRPSSLNNHHYGGLSWNINTLVASGKSSFDLGSSYNYKFAFQSDGSAVFIVHYDGQYIYLSKYSLSTAWDISTINSNPISSYTSPYEQQALYYVGGLTFSSNGLTVYFYAKHNISPAIYLGNLSTAWDITTIGSLSVDATFSTLSGTYDGLRFKSDGSMLYMNSNINNNIKQFPLGTDYILETLGSTNGNFSYSAQTTSCYGFGFSADGTSLFIIGQNESKIFQYTLSTPWSIPTAVYTGNYGNIGTSCTDGIIFQPLLSGTSINCYIMDKRSGYTTQRITEYTLT